MSAEAAVTGGGTAGLVLAFGYAAKLAWDSWQAKRAGDNAAEVTPVANAATANEMALATLEAVARERERLEKRVDEVEAALVKTRSEAQKDRDEARKERLKRESQGKRLDEHEREIGLIKRQFSLAVTYIRALLAFITDHGLTDDAPKPPSGLHLD